MRYAKNYLNNLYSKAADLNYRNILGLLENNKKANFLDLGCDNGILSKKIAGKIGADKIYGVEIVEERIRLAENNGLEVRNFDLNKEFNFDDDFFDVIHANQVIEHLYNSDNFISEIYRILKPGGYAIISTENASSWCNILAGIMGWQIFSLTNVSSLGKGIGNPFAMHKEDGIPLSSWNHVRIYNIRGLKEYLEIFKFKVEEIKGAGYFPLPAMLGNTDKTHCHFMTFKIRK